MPLRTMTIMLHIAYFSSEGPDDGQSKTETCCPNELVKTSCKLVVCCVRQSYQ